MVYRTRGCKTCKRRRVKCDATQPKCGQCQRVVEQCLWDPNVQDNLTFMNENQYARGKPRRPRNIVPVVGKSPQPPIPAAPPTSIAPNLLDVAFTHWIENFVFAYQDLPQFCHEYGTYVLPQWVRSRPGSGLHLAVSALSLATFGRAKNSTKAIESAKSFHKKSIIEARKLMSTISSEDSEQDVQNLLLTIMLMSSYENTVYVEPRSTVVSDGISGSWKSFMHHEEAVGVLGLRHEAKKPKLPFSRFIRRQIVRTCILRGRSVPTWLDSGLELGESGPALEVDTLMVRAAALREKWLTSITLRSVNTLGSAIDHGGIELEARDLDVALETWTQSLPQEWGIRVTHSDSSTPRTDNIYDGIIYKYTTPAHACIWNRYRAVRIVINSIRLQTLPYLNQHSQPSELLDQHNTLSNKQGALATDLCRTVPSFFNRPSLNKEAIGLKSIKLGSGYFSSDCDIFPKLAGLLAWPLTVAVCTSSIPDRQKVWLRQKLSTVAIALEDGVLKRIAEIGRDEFQF